MEGLPRNPWGSECELGTTFPYSYSNNDIEENFIYMLIKFAEIFLPQDFSIRLLRGSVDQQTHVQLVAVALALTII